MPEPLKDLYSPDYIKKLAKAVHQANGRFDRNSFKKAVLDSEWDSRELKARMQHIAVCLHETLPNKYPEAISILREAAEIIPKDKDSAFLDMYFPEFVSMYGADDWKTSIPALEWFTRFASSEFAVRPFILEDPSRMMKQMKKWAKSKNFHVRRLASEGCRPRLPWAMALPIFKVDPEPVLEILELLKEDSERYVVRSVANNLNDISKDNPDLMIQTVKQWAGISEEVDWLIRHACRSLLKQSHPEAMKLFGYKAKVTTLSPLSLSQDSIKMGETIEFEIQFKIAKRAKLRIEYVVGFMKKNGKQAPKVFLWADKEFEAGSHTLSQNQKFVHLTTRKHYAGEHTIHVRINGQNEEPASFQLTIP